MEYPAASVDPARVSGDAQLWFEVDFDLARYVNALRDEGLIGPPHEQRLFAAGQLLSSGAS